MFDLFQHLSFSKEGTHKKGGKIIFKRNGNEFVLNLFLYYRFRHSLMTWGEKFSGSEIDDAFGEFKIDGGMIDAEHLKSLMVAKKEGEE